MKLGLGLDVSHRAAIVCVFSRYHWWHCLY